MESAAPVLSRRHEVGAGSARGLLFTLLGEFVLPDEGGAWTSAVLAAFERMGVAEKATRQALMRTSNAGWLRADKVGRRRFHLIAPVPHDPCSIPPLSPLTAGIARVLFSGIPNEWWMTAATHHSSVEAGGKTAPAGGLSRIGPAAWSQPHGRRFI